MAKSRKGTFPTLLDLHYKYSLNEFEEFYRDSVTYSEIEQTSYIDFKDMMFEMIGRGIKFRKFGRYNGVLTVRADMTPNEYELFLEIFKGKAVDEEATNDVDRNPDGETKYLKFNFVHDFTISNIRDLTKDEQIKFKKVVENNYEDEEELN